jgi:hypothetical protein
MKSAMRITSLIVFMSICSVAVADNATSPWKKTANTLLMVDWLQTRGIATSNGRFRETNPILGSEPSLGRVNNYFLASIALLNLSDYFLPHKYTKLLYQSVSMVEVTAVSRNLQVGVKLKF